MARHRKMPSSGPAPQLNRSDEIKAPAPAQAAEPAGLPPLRPEIDRERYQALAGAAISGFSAEVSAFAVEGARRLWCQTPEQTVYVDKGGVRAVARYLAREADRTGVMGYQGALRRANVDRYIDVLATRLSDRSVRAARSQLYDVARVLFPQQYPARHDLAASRVKRIQATPQAHVLDLYALAPTLPAWLSVRLITVLDLCFGAGARSQDFKTLKGNSITEGSWGDEPVAVVRLPNSAGGSRLVPVADPEISNRLLTRAREDPARYLLPSRTGDIVERNATNRVGEHLRRHGHRSINVAALRNRWLVNIASTVPAALLLQLADLTSARLLADQREQLPTYGLNHAIALTKETYK